MGLSDVVYARLLALRTGLRQFERWSEQQAQAAGLTPAQHQLMLAIRGHTDRRGPTIRDVADYLLLRHHSVVGLVDRADAAGLVCRVRDEDDHRVVRLRLTTAGAERLERLSALHLEELERLAARLPSPRESAVEVRIASVYDNPGRSPARRILVDGGWPRALARTTTNVTLWAKDAAPSAQLRRWYADAPQRFDEFARRYRTELQTDAGDLALDLLRDQAADADVVLVTAARDPDRSAAAVLRDVLGGR
ncbi:MAG TPA: DUF488 family protein [Micromonosporaceae bacterium]|nr:DUF488 family protein [Micromonosporaceae bacterium]